jgi:glycosyl-4,4'-diaponeurosporenoate acyltransferase
VRLIYLPTFWTILLDCLAWALLQTGVAALSILIPLRYLNPYRKIFLPAEWEDGGDVYQRWFRIRSWKAKVPSWAAIFGKRGFRLDYLESTEPAYLDRWVRESCRSEICHWAAMLPAGLFFLWNKPVIAWVMVAYALIFNLPLFILQRYNRPKVMRLLVKRRNLEVLPSPDGAQDL